MDATVRDASRHSHMAGLDLSVLELLQVLNEILGLEFARTQEIHLTPVLSSVVSLQDEASTTPTNIRTLCFTGHARGCGNIP